MKTDIRKKGNASAAAPTSLLSFRKFDGMPKKGDTCTSQTSMFGGEEVTWTAVSDVRIDEGSGAAGSGTDQTPEPRAEIDLVSDEGETYGRTEHTVTGWLSEAKRTWEETYEVKE